MGGMEALSDGRMAFGVPHLLSVDAFRESGNTVRIFNEVDARDDEDEEEEEV